MMNFFPKLIATLTGVPRYRPELVWSPLWTSNLFRLYEQVFGRRIGIRAGMMQTIGYEHNFVFCFTFEDFLAQYEVATRNWFKGLLTFKVYIPQMALPYGMGSVAPQGYKFAIGFDQTTGSLGTVGPGTTVDNTVTLTGSNVGIFIGWVGNNTVTEDCTGVTYNSQALTKCGYLARLNPNASADRARYGYYRLGCSTGANTLRVSYSASAFVFGMCTSYTGVNSSGSSDIQASTIGGSPASISLTWTVPTANSWLISINSVAGYVSQSASTGAFARGVADPNTQNIYDSNGGVGTGSQSMTVTGSTPSGDNNMNMIGVSFPPVATTTFDPARFFPW